MCSYALTSGHYYGRGIAPLPNILRDCQRFNQNNVFTCKLARGQTTPTSSTSLYTLALQSPAIAIPSLLIGLLCPGPMPRAHGKHSNQPVLHLGNVPLPFLSAETTIKALTHVHLWILSLLTNCGTFPRWLCRHVHASVLRISECRTPCLGKSFLSLHVLPKHDENKSWHIFFINTQKLIIHRKKILKLNKK
jgi:hypothetical protein